MKFVSYLFSAIIAMVLISACQKELDFESDGLAHGTLKSDLTGDCLPSAVNGIYKADSLLDSNNFIDIQVNLTATGTYDIKSDTVNGYSFRGTGTLGIVGTNSIRLYATGKPLLSGTDIFTIKFDGTICNIYVTVIGTGTGVAVYTLGGAPGNCASTVNGIYTQGTALDVNNTVTLTVNVTATGTYTLGASPLPLNGMFFTAVGVFTTTGVQSVTLNGNGNPQTAGIINVVATNLSSTCSFNVTVLPTGGGGPAIYTLDGVGGACSGATYAGTYAAGMALSSSNQVLLNVSVATIGTYTITTNTVNGMTFSATGTFASAGSQTVTLTGSGTPVTGGIFNFTATAGISTCTFSITVTATANQDYIPETAFSNWTDKLVGGTAADTSYVQVSPNTIIKNGTTYKIFEVQENTIPSDSSFHRKNGGLYYQLFNQDYGFDNPFNVDGLLLDSTLAVNSTWDINLGSNTAGGTPATAVINVKIIEKGASAVIQGTAYTNVIKVTYTYNYNIGAGNTAFAVEEIWYAKGKGVINYQVNDVPVTFTDIYETTRIQIF